MFVVADSQHLQCNPPPQKKKLPLHSLHSALWGFLSFGVGVGVIDVIDVSHVTDRMCENM